MPFDYYHNVHHKHICYHLYRTYKTNRFHIDILFILDQCGNLSLSDLTEVYYGANYHRKKMLFYCNMLINMGYVNRITVKGGTRMSITDPALIVLDSYIVLYNKYELAIDKKEFKRRNYER